MRFASSLEISRQSRHKNLGLQIQPTAFPARHAASLIISRFAGVNRTTCRCRCELYCCAELTHHVSSDSQPVSATRRKRRLLWSENWAPRGTTASPPQGGSCCCSFGMLSSAPACLEPFPLGSGDCGVEPAAHVQRRAALSGTGLEPLEWC